MVSWEILTLICLTDASLFTNVFNVFKLWISLGLQLLFGTRLRGETTKGLKLTFSIWTSFLRSPKSLQTTLQFLSMFSNFTWP